MRLPTIDMFTAVIFHRYFIPDKTDSATEYQGISLHDTRWRI